MLFYLTTRIVSSTTAFLYPGYASYKTLSQRPASEEELERWLMYWSVLGCIVGVEYLFEWVVSWVPFYYSLKSLFLLYLVLPQTQGASYIYTAHLQPFFHAHERQIDNMLAQLKARAYRFVQERFRALWDVAAASLQGQQPNAASVQQPQQSNRESGLAPAQIVGSLWRAYGPSIMASGAAFLRSAPPPSTSTLGTLPPPTFSNPNYNPNAEQSLLDRRRKLAAELAALDTLIPSGSSTSASTTSASTPELGAGLRERTNSGSGRFEEVEVPSDVEGYEIGDNHGNDEGQGHARPAVQGRASWFGWAIGSSKGGYERIKSE